MFIGRLPGLLKASNNLQELVYNTLHLINLIKQLKCIETYLKLFSKGISLFGVGCHIFLVQISELAGYLIEFHYLDLEGKIKGTPRLQLQDLATRLGGIQVIHIHSY